MDVREFLIYFRNDIPDSANIEWTFDDYLQWHPIFFEKTSEFHQKAKQSYFEQTNKLVDENNFQRYFGIGALSEFAYLGLFNKEDEDNFSELVRKLTYKVNAIENEPEMEDVLHFIYSLVDFLLHEIYPEENSDLRKSLIEMKIKILEKDRFDHENTGELVIRFIDLMI